MKKLLMVALIIFIILVILGLFLFTTNKQTNLTPLPTPTPVGILPRDAQSNDYKITQSQKLKLSQEGLVSALINKVPYRGNNFLLDYNFSKGVFILVLNQNNLDQANSEFNQFLQQNGIQNRSWFANLSIFIQPIPPVP